jgi:hypothetical protein
MLRTMAVGLLLLWPVSAEAACRGRFSFNLGQASVGTITTPSGASCTVRVDRTAGTTVMKSIRMASPPKNGTASAGSIGVTYRSRPGYKGSDSFAFTNFGDGKAGTNLTATIQMNVTVQ